MEQARKKAVLLARHSAAPAHALQNASRSCAARVDAWSRRPRPAARQETRCASQRTGCHKHPPRYWQACADACPAEVSTGLWRMPGREDCLLVVAVRPTPSTRHTRGTAAKCSCCWTAAPMPSAATLPSLQVCACAAVRGGERAVIENATFVRCDISLTHLFALPCLPSSDAAFAGMAEHYGIMEDPTGSVLASAVPVEGAARSLLCVPCHA